jgi:hypothetical protein
MHALARRNALVFLLRGLLSVNGGGWFEWNETASLFLAQSPEGESYFSGQDIGRVRASHRFDYLRMHQR